MKGWWRSPSGQLNDPRCAKLSLAARGLLWSLSDVADGRGAVPLGAMTLDEVVLDDDNLASACKAARDAVALWLVPVTQTLRKGPRAGTTRLVGDDRDPRVEWSVAQEKGPYGVRVEIVPVRPFGEITTARVVPEGIVTQVECVLGPKATGVFAAALADLARGDRQQVALHVGAVRLVVRAPERTST